MDGDNFFGRILLAIPTVIVLWLCLWLIGKLDKRLGLGGRLYKRKKDTATNDSHGKKDTERKSVPCRCAVGVEVLARL